MVCNASCKQKSFKFWIAKKALQVVDKDKNIAYNLESVVMLIFLIFWIPVCFILWRKVVPQNCDKLCFYENICAVLTGIAIGIIRFFQLNFVTAYGFELSRYVSSFIDYVGLPVILPLVVCTVFLRVKKLEHTPDWTGFLLISLIPVVLISAIRWGTEPNSLLLVMVPLIWTIEAAGLYSMVKCIKNKYLHTIICIIIIPFLASAVWWLFFSQKNLLAVALLIVLMIPAALTVFMLKTKLSKATQNIE
jgi:hypothetical protein